MEPRDFFDQVNLTRDVCAPRWTAARPCCRRIVAAAVIGIHTYGCEAQSGENRFDVRIGHVRAHHAQHFLARQLDRERRRASRINVHDAGEHFAATELLN